MFAVDVKVDAPFIAFPRKSLVAYDVLISVGSFAKLNKCRDKLISSSSSKIPEITFQRDDNKSDFLLSTHLNVKALNNSTCKFFNG